MNGVKERVVDNKRGVGFLFIYLFVKTFCRDGYEVKLT